MRFRRFASIGRATLTEKIGTLPSAKMVEVERGLQLVLGLPSHGPS